ncbi:MAG: protein-L-isoaspartate(D-aspartate) O-methyltransferase [Pseudomonadota bacterium]
MAVIGQSDQAERRARHLMAVRALGITDLALFKAIEATPRDSFVAPQWHGQLYSARSVPMACGQDMTSPLLVAQTVHFLSSDSSSRVLELGTGSGYQTAILARLARQVVTVERYATLVDQAKLQHERLGLSNIEHSLADGRDGLPSYGPYDRIIVNFALPEPPRVFLEQMTVGARLVAPIGSDASRQILTAFDKIGSRFEARQLAEVSFAPPIAGVAKAL